MSAVQTYANHVRIPPWHYVIAGLAVLLNACYLLWQLPTSHSCGAVLGAVSAVAVVAIWFYSRRYAQQMQDRIIRLEVQVRLRALLPPERHGGIARLSLGQLVALRFAGDAELPALVDRVLAGELAEPDAIKRAVREWQPDHMRV